MGRLFLDERNLQQIGFNLPNIETLRALTDYLNLTETVDGHTTSLTQKQPLDADLTAIAALATNAAGRSILTLSDPNADRAAFWDDSAGAITWLSTGLGLEINDTTLRLASGTSFPGSPADGDLFWRTDREILYVYDSTLVVWLSAGQQQQIIATVGDADLTASATVRTIPNPWWGTYDIRLYDAVFTAHSSAGSAQWTFDLYSFDAAAFTLRATANTSGDAATTYVNDRVAINATLGSAVEGFQLNITENSGAADLSVGVAIGYRLVG